MSRLETTVGFFARRGFTDPEAAERIAGDWDECRSNLIDTIGESGDPDLALSGLARLAERVPDLWDRVTENPVLGRQLSFVVAASLGLQQHLLAHPQDIEQLAEPCTRRPAAALREELLQAVGADPAQATPVTSYPASSGETATSPDLDAGDRLRLAYRAALLRIAARDLTDHEPIEILTDVAAELSDLADATLEAALAVARAIVGSDAGLCRLAVVSLGKTGAQELNYLSDVDVLFVGEPATDGDGEPMVPIDRALAVATRLAAELTRICGAHTRCGTIWQVDAALRPEGKAGPLVRTLASHEKYYRDWAHTWEFQAMLKARPSAGDLGLGAQFVDIVSPLVWQAAERDHFVTDTQAMRQRVVEHIPSRDADRELKLGRGGLRDVEFSVQLLQLVHGRVDERLRVRGTLPALRLLVECGYVGREDGKSFGLSYRFLRTLEHRIQLFRLRRTHVLPTDATDLRRLGRSLHYREPETELVSTWRSVIQRVSRLQERLFYSPLLDAVARIPTSELRLTTGSATDRLRALGYQDPAAALRHIQALSSGMTRQAEIQRQLLPAMLGWFAVAPEPDPGLLAFRQVSEALGTTPWYLRALRDEGAMAQRLARILASSRYAVELLKRAPQSVQLLAVEGELTPRTFAQLGTEMSKAAGRQADATGAVEAIRAIRRRELFRIAAGDLLGELDVHDVGRALTDLASATIDTALTAVRTEVGADVPEIAVVAMGRWGGRELSYASDADAMFVMGDAGVGNTGVGEAEAGEAGTGEAGTGDAGTAVTADRTKIAGAVITTLRRLLATPGADPALQLDADLRPEGKGGALIRSLAAYRNYYSRWSSTWEMQALVRADALAGNPDVGRELMSEIEARRWPEGGLTAGQLVEIRRLKARVETERMPKGADPTKHLKFGPGGLADIEWTVQVLQLQHAWEQPTLRTTQTVEALRAARTIGLVHADDAVVLERSWTMASRLRNQIMLVRGRGSDAMPTDAGDLAAVAELMGHGPSEASHLLAEWRRVSRRARQVVDRVFWGEH
ncbi:MAG: bifunctional [glutamine synthetase] adenylyltransferase/[glutamine synthetase]-adenylyl-L-tyrosine phosphorylase [Propionibacteriaceae bacterium]